MSERTVAFILGGVTVWAWVIVFNGLFRSSAVSHPDSGLAQGMVKLTG